MNTIWWMTRQCHVTWSNDISRDMWFIIHDIDANIPYSFLIIRSFFSFFVRQVMRKNQLVPVSFTFYPFFRNLIFHECLSSIFWERFTQT